MEVTDEQAIAIREHGRMNAGLAMVGIKEYCRHLTALCDKDIRKLSFADVQMMKTYMEWMEDQHEYIVQAMRDGRTLKKQAKRAGGPDA